MYIRLPFDVYKLLFYLFILIFSALDYLFYSYETKGSLSWVLCYKDGTALPPLDFNTNCITNGRYVIFYNERKDGITYPVGYETQSVYSELCEVYVLGMLKKCIFKKVIYNIRILFLFNKCFSSL